MVSYLLSVLKGLPVSPPKASQEQWPQFFSVLVPHWILPLLYWQIRSLPEECHPPKNVMDQMRQVFLLNSVRAFHLETQIREALTAFEKEAVRILVLKGPALGRSVYPDPATREGSDLDLLVLPGQMIRARRILENLGYLCQDRRFEVSRDFYCEEKFVPPGNAGGKRLIELHWDLHRFSGIRREAGIEELFTNAVRISHSALAFEALHPVDALIHRSLNNAFIHDQDMRLSWIYDVVLLARSLRVPEDWEVLQQRSVDWRARLALEHSLTLARIWGGLELPPAYADFSTWPRPTKTEIDGWYKATRRHERLSEYLSLHMSHASGRLEKLRFFIHLLFPSPDYMRVKYPPSKDGLLFLSYVRRWRRWLSRLLPAG